MPRPRPRPRRIVLASMAASVAMGQQGYEAHLADALTRVAGTGWEVRTCRVRSLRSRAAGERRLPLEAVGSLPTLAGRWIGRATYGRAAVVHRLDLRIPPPAAPEVLTIHDLAPLRFGDEGRLPGGWQASVRAATAVVVSSDFTAAELEEATGVRAAVIGPGHDPELVNTPPLGADTLASLGISPPYVLHAGGATDRKNLAALAGAWAVVRSERPDATLVLCGPPDARRDRHFAALPGTVRPGRLDRPTLVGLLCGAALVVVPSTYEGFGLPALEALTAGVPVVASDRGSLPEVVGDAGLLVEPTDAGLAEGILATLADPEGAAARAARGRARARERSWDDVAADHLNLYRRVAR